jgi:DMSO/TMAO reductase YedYZ molybdopterin-dependent catalytic subunit
VNAESWRLRIDGMVDRPYELSYKDLLAGDLISADVTLACVSNEVGGTLVGNARWTGVRLDALLAKAGVKPGADQIVGRSVDGFTTGFPVAALDGRAAMVAVAMNGAPLPRVHGFPVRLVVPGLYGYVSATKWLRQIELTTFDAFDAYWVRRGWARMGPIKLESRVDVPRDTGIVRAGRRPIAGVAWAPHRGVAKVEVRVDEGAWREAVLGPTLGADAWRQWHLDWDATRGHHVIQVRAVTNDGEVQTAQTASPFPDGATGYHRVRVEVT